MNNVLRILTANRGPVSIRFLALAHAGGKQPGGKNYRLVRKLVDKGVIFQVGDNLFLKG